MDLIKFYILKSNECELLRLELCRHAYYIERLKRIETTAIKISYLIGTILESKYVDNKKDELIKELRIRVS